MLAPDRVASRILADVVAVKRGDQGHVKLLDDRQRVVARTPEVSVNKADAVAGHSGDGTASHPLERALPERRQAEREAARRHSVAEMRHRLAKSTALCHDVVGSVRPRIDVRWKISIILKQRHDPTHAVVRQHVSVQF